MFSKKSLKTRKISYTYIWKQIKFLEINQGIHKLIQIHMNANKIEQCVNLCQFWEIYIHSPEIHNNTCESSRKTEHDKVKS